MYDVRTHTKGVSMEGHARFGRKRTHAFSDGTPVASVMLDDDDAHAVWGDRGTYRDVYAYAWDHMRGAYNVVNTRSTLRITSASTASTWMWNRPKGMRRGSRVDVRTVDVDTLANVRTLADVRACA